VELHDEIEHLTRYTLHELAVCVTIAAVAKESAKTYFKDTLEPVNEETKKLLDKIDVALFLEDSDTLISKWVFINFVAIYEAWTSDILRAILRKYPQKLKKEKEELRGILYGGPKGVTKRLQEITSIEMGNIPELAEVIRLKAVRDILLHNKGIVNKTYLRKSGDTKATEGDKIKTDAHFLLVNCCIFNSFVIKVSDELVKKYK